MTDFYDLFEQNFEIIVLSIKDSSISELARQIAACLLIEEAFLKLATPEELKEWFEFNPKRARSVHLYDDVLEEFFGSYELYSEVEKIFYPEVIRRNSFKNFFELKSILKASVFELEEKGWLKILKAYSWSDYDVELTKKLTKYQTIPYSIICR